MPRSQLLLSITETAAAAGTGERVGDGVRQTAITQGCDKLPTVRGRCQVRGVRATAGVAGNNRSVSLEVKD